ncbi:MAG: hypothetical protein EOM46_18880, partial [Gammaproteobacteria bacterium]|nr:hypothetical protein [Gammaproteobacteria bacterium]
MKTDCPVENSPPLPHTIFSQFSLLLMMSLPVIIHTRITGDAMKLITCFKLVPEEQDIVVTPERSLN